MMSRTEIDIPGGYPLMELVFIHNWGWHRSAINGFNYYVSFRELFLKLDMCVDAKNMKVNAASKYCCYFAKLNLKGAPQDS